MFAEQLCADIDYYLAPILREYEQRLIRHTQPKILRDVKWGFNRYTTYELAVIDSPPFQRLRNISQTSLAMFTYPSATHSRFEHSLGVSSIASRMLAAIETRGRDLDQVLRIETRLAALLHDLGHGPFSHSSEKFFEGLPPKNSSSTDQTSIFDLIRIENPSLFSDASAGEILTYLMITSRSFKDLWSRIVEMYRPKEIALRDVKLERMASMILGSDAFVGGTGRFYRQIVNGPFDADKLDYLPRDGYHTGLEIAVDIERLLNTVTVVEKNGETEIAVVASGATVLEQVLFSKTQLYASMYHHHKVRAAHQLIQRLISTMLKRSYKPSEFDLRDPISYIALDDHDLLQSGHNDPDVKSIVQKIKMRVFPMRALVITHPCFDDQESREKFISLNQSDFETITSEAERELRLHDGSIIFDAPDQPRLDGTGQALVELAPGGEPIPLQKLYPAGAWAKAYAGYRRMTYVFTSASDLRSVGIKVQSILASPPYNIRLNNNALALAKL